MNILRLYGKRLSLDPSRKGSDKSFSQGAHGRGTDGGRGWCDPDGVGDFPRLPPWVAPTATHIAVLRTASPMIGSNSFLIRAAKALPIRPNPGRIDPGKRAGHENNESRNLAIRLNKFAKSHPRITLDEGRVKVSRLIIRQIYTITLYSTGNTLRI